MVTKEKKEDVFQKQTKISRGPVHFSLIDEHEYQDDKREEVTVHTHSCFQFSPGCSESACLVVATNTSMHSFHSDVTTWDRYLDALDENVYLEPIEESDRERVLQIHKVV